MKKHAQLHAEYYEAIIQLRPSTEELLRFIERSISERKDVFISKILPSKNGVDIYISSQRFARSLGQKLKRRFKGELKITRSLYSRDRMSGKLLYRATVLFRLAPKEDKPIE